MKKKLEDNKELIMLEAAKFSVRKLEQQKRKEFAEAMLREAKMRRFLRAMLLNEIKISNKVPYTSTGINILQQLLKKIIPVIEENFKSLTTSQEQRDSFRAHIINAMINTVEPPRSLRDAEMQYLMGEVPRTPAPKAQSIPINELADGGGQLTSGPLEPTQEEEAPPGFIDLDGDGQPDPTETFGKGLEHLDSTGRNLAYETYRKIEKTIGEHYAMLDNDVDRQLFFNYLLTNAKLYLDRFEEELVVFLEEPTTDEYQDITGDRLQGSTVPPEDQPPGEPPMENPNADSLEPDYDPESAEQIAATDELGDIREI